jgi:hypothetical protein
LLARATADDPVGRPSMSTLASGLTALAEPDPPHRSAPGALRRLALALPAALVVLGTGLGWLRGGPADSGDGAPAPAPAAVTPATATSTSSTTVAVTDDIGTPETVRLWPAATTVQQGNVLRRDGARWVVGRSTDVVVVGNWGCGGTETPAVLRPGTGGVWVFDQWAEEGAPVVGRPVARLPDAVSLRVRRGGGCDRLEVVDADGSTSLVGW